MKPLVIILLTASMVLSCGEAGIQTKVINDFTYEIEVIPEPNRLRYTSNRSSDIQEELEKYGSEILDLDLEKIQISIEGYESGDIDGTVDLFIENNLNVFAFEDEEFVNNGVYTIPNADVDRQLVDRVQAILRNNEEIDYRVSADFTIQPEIDTFKIFVKFFAESTVKTN